MQGAAMPPPRPAGGETNEPDREESSRMSQTQTMPQAEAPKIKSRLAAILRTTSGNFLEQFDFFLAGIYAKRMAETFYPSDMDKDVALALAFVTFWIGALMRPLGAIVLGAYLDKIGRRNGLILTLSIMAVGTFTIAFAPTYAMVGVAAPIIVLIGRLVQGFSAGVELGGVSIYLFEIATPGNKGFYTAFQSGSQQVAILVAAVIGFSLNELLLPQQISDWGWRIPFFIGCLIVPFIFVIRRSLEETPEFVSQKKHPTAAQILRSVAQNWQTVFLGMNLVALTTVMFYFTTVYTPSFGRDVLKLPELDSLLVTMCVAVMNFIWLPVGGALSDRIGRKPVLITIAVLALATAYPALWWLAAEPTFQKMLAVELTFSFYFGIYNGAMVVSLSELVPAHVRASGFSLAYSLAAALFGTFTPVFATVVVKVTGSSAAPGFWLMFAAYCSLTATAAFYRGGTQTQQQSAG
jgi:MHS family citrate/tricarballylate:H+ symporter-like MFS transporter